MCVMDIVVGRLAYPKFTGITNAAVTVLPANPLRYGLFLYSGDAGSAIVVQSNGVEWHRVYGPQLGSGAMGEVGRLFLAKDYGTLITGEIGLQYTTAGTGRATELLLPDSIGYYIQEYAKKLPKPVY